MRWIDNFKKAIGIRAQPRNGMTLSDINAFFGNSAITADAPGRDISEITYFTCLKVLSESVGKLSLHLKDADNNKIVDHDVYYAIRIRPNKFMTPYTFKLLMEFNRNHYGNAYAYIKHDAKGKLEGIYPLKSQNVTIWLNNTDEMVNIKHFYQYVHPQSGKIYNLLPEDVLHLKGGIPEDGLCGMCVREVLARNMQGNKESQNFLNSLYRQGLTANAVVKYVGDLDKAKRAKLVKDLTEFSLSTTDRIIPIPFGMDLVPLNLKLTDSQFYELKKFSSLQIAAAFGVSPNQLNNYEKSSYANSEAQSLAFYVSTLLPNLTGWEEEMNAKLLTKQELLSGMGFEFNVATILRGDIKSQAEALNHYVTGSIYTINEARSKAGLPPLNHGEVVLVNGSYTDLKDLGKAYNKKGGEGK